MYEHDSDINLLIHFLARKQMSKCCHDITNSPTGDVDAPASTHVERSATCAQVRYSPTLQQQNSISSKGLNADFIIQYDVELRDLMGEIQVRSSFLRKICAAS